MRGKESFPGGLAVESPPASEVTWVQFLVQEDSRWLRTAKPVRLYSPQTADKSQRSQK